jgi:heme/copper-type cytochrome/quinol oxidase subunit 1
MSILLVYPAVLAIVAAIIVAVRHASPRPATARSGRPLARTVAFIVGALIAAPVMALIGFAGVGKRLS